MRAVMSLLIAIVFSVTAFATPARAETVDFTIVLTSDIYKIDGDDGRGGYARLNAVVKAERAKGGNVIFVNAGDVISPSLLSGLDQGEHGIVLSNIVPPDFFTPGNHEYDFGADIFRKRMSEAKFPLFAANLRTADGQPLPGFQDTTIRDVGGLKLGFVGLTAEDSPTKSSPGDTLAFAPTFDTAVARAKDLRAQGADLIVIVAHAARPVDLKLYESGDFDIVLSGDDHDLVMFYDGHTVLAESMLDANYVIAMDIKANVSVEDGQREVTWWPDFRVIDTEGVTPDPETQARVDEYLDELKKDLDVAIGTTSEPLDSRKSIVRTQEAAIGNMVTDAMRAATGADAALVNGGGFRGNRQYPAGSEITRRDILAEMPFGNHTVKLAVTGDVIRAALEHGVSDVADAAGRFPQVSGLSFTADLTKPAGQRIGTILIDGKPLDPAGNYTLATNDYIASGGDGYAVLEAGKPLLGVRDGKLVVNDVMAYIIANKTVAPKVEGRIKLKM